MDERQLAQLQDILAEAEKKLKLAGFNLSFSRIEFLTPSALQSAGCGDVAREQLKDASTVSVRCDAWDCTSGECVGVRYSEA